MLLNEKEPYHSYQDPFEDGEIRHKVYFDDNHIIIHYMETIPEECGYTDPIYSDDSDKENVNPMGKGSAIYGMSHDEKAAKLISSAYSIAHEADSLCACGDNCTCHWMINWNMS